MTFAELSEYIQRIESTPKRNEMTEILSELFTRASAEEIDSICYLLQGRVAPLYEATEFGIADKIMMRAIARATHDTEVAVASLFKTKGDLGSVGEYLKDQNSNIKTKDGSEKLSVCAVFDELKTIALCVGEGSQEIKVEKLSQLLIAVDALSAKYIVRITLGKLRLGFSNMTMLDALSHMLEKNKSCRDRIEEVFDVRPDLGYIAKTLKEDGIHGLSHIHATVGAPILAALCQRLPNALEMISKMGEVDVEPKYDGVRTQIHFKRMQKSKIKTQNERKYEVWGFSRNLENTTAMYPELEHIADEIQADEVILDSEAVGYDPDSDRVVPFQETVTRKRKHDISLFSESVPLRFFVFDILYKDGVDLMGEPLQKRRAILETIISSKEVLSVSPHIVTSDADTLREYHDEQIKKGLEGVVVKQWDSQYVPGRRGYNWVKFKEDEGKTGKLSDTIDCVVMGYDTGEGKRTGFGIGAFLVGIKDGERYVSVTKIGTGVSDDLWKALKIRFTKQSTTTRPKQFAAVPGSLEPDFWIHPFIVVEIGADDITKSPVHAAGYALRFPRLVGIREDKGPEEATTLSEFVTMYEMQGKK